MAAIAIDPLPDEMLKRLQRLAGSRQNNVEQEALDCLERGMRQREEAERTLERLRLLRASMPNAWLTEEFLRDAKNEGRL